MYRALYRTWRPATFSDVVGQTSIVEALQNQLLHDKVGHAYLFTGTRGTGKTTCAKIFAKAVNCQHRNGADPCCVCPVCTGIDDGSVMDVVEIDAASNNGVDNIRDLRDETAYTPSAATYKVYIIDEVHMLSTAAFNALLKIMEEPPAHVIFILATTEIHKVPATILSRCQRYDFTRITPEDIVGRLLYVAGQEGIALTQEGAGLIARLADGAMRDALSILDTCAGVSMEVDVQLVRRMAGVTDKSYLFSVSEAVTRRDAPQVLTLIAQLREKSVDLKRLCDELILHYRNLLLAGVAGGQRLLTGVSAEEEQQYLAAAQTGQPAGVIIRAIQSLSNALDKMGKGTDPRIELELALFELCGLYPGKSVAEAAAAPQTVVTACSNTAQMPACAVQPATQNAEMRMQPEGIRMASNTAAESKSSLPRRSDEGEAETGAGLGLYGHAQSTSHDTGKESPAPSKPQEEPTQANATAKISVQCTEKDATARDTAFAEKQACTGQPFAAWDAVLDRMKERDGLLYANLRNSKAYREGKRVLIDGSDLFMEYMRKNEYSATLIKKTIADVTGIQCGIGPYKKDTASAITHNIAQENLEQLSQMGVPVEYQDE